jgi:hypothetical protein
MLKSHLFPSGRIRMYWDGAALLAHADSLRDPSTNWLDLPAMAPLGATHVWIAPAAPPERPLKAAIVAHERALSALGVDCRPAPLQGAATECLRCGHGWHDHSSARELALALAVLEDGLADAFDAAFVFASPGLLAAVANPLGRLFPEKGLGRVTLGPAMPRRAGARAKPSPSLRLEAVRLPCVVEGDDGALIAQPACWRSPAAPSARLSSTKPSARSTRLTGGVSP